MLKNLKSARLARADQTNIAKWMTTQPKWGFFGTVEAVQKEPLLIYLEANDNKVQVVPEEPLVNGETVKKILLKVLGEVTEFSEEFDGFETFSFSNVRFLQKEKALEIVVGVGSEVTPYRIVNAADRFLYYFIAMIKDLNDYLHKANANMYDLDLFYEDRFLIFAKIVRIGTDPGEIFYSACRKDRAKTEWNGEEYECTKCRMRQDFYPQLKIAVTLEDERGTQSDWRCMALTNVAERLLDCSSEHLYQLSRDDHSEMVSILRSVLNRFMVIQLIPNEFREEYKMNLDAIL